MSNGAQNLMALVFMSTAVAMGFLVGMQHESQKHPFRPLELLEIERPLPSCRTRELIEAVEMCQEQRATWEKKARGE